MQGKLLFIFFFIFLSNFSIAQTYTQTIRGKVIDKDSKTSIPGANVILTGSDTLIVDATDAEGKFRLEQIPVGRRGIKVSLIGYEEFAINNIIVTSGKEVVLVIELQEKVYTANAVEIVENTDKTKANNDLATISSRSFQAEETGRYAGSRNDPSKMVANYAGVTGSNDARNDIIVRGNSPLGVLWRLEGVDIPNPNHFSAQGATGGPMSMLNNNVLGNSDFLTGAFPAEYGNKTAAVFDLKLRNGNNEKLEFTGQLGINGIELGAEGPISKKTGSSYLVNYRYSTLEVFNKLGISFGVSASPKYQDLCYKINLPTSKAGIFTLWGLGGKSQSAILDSEVKPGDWSFIPRGEDLIFQTGMAAVGASHHYFFNSHTTGKLNISFSGSDINAYVDTISDIDKSKFRDRENHSKEGNIILNYTLLNKINTKHLIKSGITSQTIFFNANAFWFSNKYNQYMTTLDVKTENATILQAYSHWQYRPTNKLTFNTGIHYQQFLLNNSWAIEPRLGLKYKLTPLQTLSVGYGMHSQMQPTIYYFFQTYNPYTYSYNRTNRNLDFNKSQHVIFGYDYNFAADFRLKFESYYQYNYNIPIERNINSTFSMINVGNALDGIPLVDSLVNQGDGENYGIEITIEKFFSKHYYFLATASIYDSKYKGQSKVIYNTSYNGGYVVNLLAGYELNLGKNKNKAISLDIKYTLAGGNRYTPIDLNKSAIAGKAIFIDEQSFTKKYKDYSRFDVKLNLKLNHKKIAQSLFIVVENIFSTKNILQESYNVDTKKIQTEYQLGLFPYFGYRIEF